jgi:hypothetical protein
LVELLEVHAPATMNSVPRFTVYPA